MQSTLEREQNLWTASQVIVEAWRETISMLDELSALVAKTAPSVLQVTAKEMPRSAYDEEAGGWAFQALMARWGLTPTGRGKRNPVGYMYAAAALGARQGAKAVFERPSLTVGYASAVVGEPADDEAIRLDLASYWENVDLLGDCLTTPEGHSGTALNDQQADWAFAVPLFALSDTVALDQFVVQPAMALMAGKPYSEVFSEHPTVLRFTQLESGAVRLKG